jgi:hypothetical protein
VEVRCVEDHGRLELGACDHGTGRRGRWQSLECAQVRTDRRRRSRPCRPAPPVPAR